MNHKIIERGLVVGQDYRYDQLGPFLATLPNIHLDMLSVRAYDLELYNDERRRRMVGLYTLPIFYRNLELAMNFLMVEADPLTMRCIFVDPALAEIMPAPAPPTYRCAVGNHILTHKGQEPSATAVIKFIDGYEQVTAIIELGDFAAAAQALREKELEINYGLSRDSKEFAKRVKQIRKALGYSYP